FTVNRIRFKEDRANLISELQLTSYSPQLEKEWRLLEPPKLSDVDKSDEPKNNNGSEGSKDGKGAGDNESDRKGSDNHTNGSNGSNGSNDSGKEKDYKKFNPAGINRNHMIPMGVSLKFGTEHKRCHRIFTELKKMTHSEHQNSLAVMLRVFIELSLNTYFDTNKLVFVDSKNPKRTPGLHDKVILVSNDLFEKKIISGAQKTAILSYSKQMTNAGSSLQQYVHNANLIPSKEFVNTEWDNFQPLIESIWKVVS
ncbi:hypothetical protein PN547_004188, partial [Cronobacter sakazakii]|nr:hypothetical protein [Cronobacter sakazakii]